MVFFRGSLAGSWELFVGSSCQVGLQVTKLLTISWLKLAPQTALMI